MTAAYRHLNDDAVWRDFDRRGVEVAPDGTLHLATLPGTFAAGGGDAAGVAVAPDGAVWWTAGRTLWRRGPCDLVPVAVRRLDAPTAVAATYGHVYAADRGGIVGVYADSGRPAGVWTDVRKPVALAPFAGGLAVAEADGVAWLDRRGDRRFTVLSGTEIVALATRGTHLLVAERHRPAVAILDSEGRIVGRVPLPCAAPTVALVALATGAVLATDIHGVVRKYAVPAVDRWDLLGERPWPTSVRGVAVAPCGRLAVLAGNGPVWVDPAGSCESDGLVRGGPFPNPIPGPVSWHRLTVAADVPSAGAAVQVLVRLDGERPPPLPDARTAADLRDLHAGPVAGRWFRAPLNALACTFPARAGDQIWIALVLTSDGDATPRVHQARLDHGEDAVARRLPECYFADAPAGGFTARFTGLLAGLFEPADAAIADLPRRYDPEAAPDAALPELAALVGLAADAGRAEILAAAEARRWRGTAKGIRDALRARFGPRFAVAIDEPIRQARVWMLPSDDGTPVGGTAIGAVLGVTTAPASSEPAGAVVGVSLRPDRTEILPDDAYGRNLFGHLAHRVRVRVPACDRPGYRDDVRAVVAAQVPAHVRWEVGFVPPGAELGAATLGVDAVLGTPPAATLFRFPAVPPRLGVAELGTTRLAASHPEDRP